MAVKFRPCMSLLPAAGVISHFCSLHVPPPRCPARPACAARLQKPSTLASARPRFCPTGVTRTFMASVELKQAAEEALPAKLSPGPISRKRVEILNGIGQKLVGYLDVAGSENVVILCHGFRSSKDSGTLGIVADALLEAGISVFRFDFSGNGESEGEFAYANNWEEVEDLRSVVLHWRREGLKVHQIAGHSKGGSAVLLYASKYQDVGTVVNISGRCFTANGVKERLGEQGLQEIEKNGFFDVNDRFGSYRITKKGLEDRLALNMKLEVAKIPATCRVLTVHGSEDDVVSVEDALEFDKLIVNHELFIIDGADHRFRSHVTELGHGVVKRIQDDKLSVSE